MNNLILLIILLLIIIIFNVYLLHRVNNNTKNYENFTDLTPAQISVITNLSPHLIAIKNLAGLADELMKGSLTIPGGLKINGDLNVSGKSTLANDTTIKTTLQVDGTSTINNTLTVGGHSNITGNLNVKGNSDVKGVSFCNDDIIIKKNLQVDGTSTVNGTTTIKGNTTLNGTTNLNDKLYLSKFQRKYMAGGFFHVLYAHKDVPLYNGFNFFWSDQVWSKYWRNRVRWNGSSAQNYFHNHETDMRSDGTHLFFPQFIAIMPGYKAKLYYHINDWIMGVKSGPIYNEGEYDLSKLSITKACHIIALALVEEDLPPDSIDISILGDPNPLIY